MTQWILTSSVLILLVIAVRGLFKEKMKAKYTYALWLLVLVRLLCPVNFGELSFNLLTLAEEGKAQVVERMEEREEEQSSQQMMQEFGETVYLDNGKVVTVLPYYPGEVSYEVSEQVSAVETAEDNTTEAVPVAKDSGFQFPEIHWQKVLPVVWAVGMVVIALVIVSVNISFSTMLGLFRKELPTFTRKGRGSQKLSVYLADGIYSSCLYGVVRPSIYLNRKGMGEQEKKYCIEHEYSHYLQGDMVWSVCRIVCLILHWYNPLVWLAVTLSKKDAELACDERTIERLGEEERYSYGHTLVELAANQSKAVQMFGMATLMASDKKEVVNRVKAITTKKQTKIITGLLVVCLLVGIGCFVFTGVAKGEQENNNNNAEQVVAEVTETPVPTEKANAAPTVALTTAPAEDTAGEEETKSVAAVSPTPMPTIVVDIDSNRDTYATFLDNVLAEKQFPIEGMVAVNKLNVRYGASMNTMKVAVLSLNTKVTILDVKKDESNNYWYKIFCNENQNTQVGYVKSDYITWAGSFRLYESRDVNSAYIEVGYLQNVIRGVVDAGCEWFYVETSGLESGWVLYGEHSGVDEKIRELLRISEQDWDKVRAEKKQTVVLTLEEDVNYTALSFTDHVALEQIKGEGWTIDLNGDGIPENLYIDANGVFVNGERKFLFSNKQSFWLLDIDTTDSMYELLNSNGDMYIYDGKKFQCVKGIEAIYFAEESVGTPKTFKRYFGTLNEFARIDEHTISFEDYFSMGAGFFAVAQYALDENHGLQVIPQEYDITVKKQVFNIEWGDDNNSQTKNFKLYAERDLTGDYVEVSELSEISMLKSDCVEWVYVESVNGLSGWFYYGEKMAIEYEVFWNVDEAKYTDIMLRLYKEKSENAEYVDVPFNPTKIAIATSDSADKDEWLHIKLKTGESGWVTYGFNELFDWYKNELSTGE